MTKIWDVVVVGGGPSGLNVAKRISESGMDALVLDGRAGIGEHKICAGIVGREAFDEFDLNKDSLLKAIQSIKVFSLYNSYFHYTHPYEFAYVVDREKFDRYIADLAISKGSEIKVNSRVLSIHLNGDYVEIEVKEKDNGVNRYFSKIVVISTGVNFKLNKMLDLGYPEKFLNAAQAHIKVEDVNSSAIYVGKDVAPGAFAWVVPVGGGIVRVGLMTEGDARYYFQKLLNKISPYQNNEEGENNGEGVSVIEEVQLKPIAQGLVSKTYGDRVMVVGEAAGQVKTTTGGGIYYGLLCSEIAADVIMKAFKYKRFDSNFLSEYEKRWKDKIGNEIKVGYYMRKIYSKMSDKQIEKLFQIAQSDGIISFIRERAMFDWHSELIFTLLKLAPVKRLLGIDIKDILKNVKREA